MPAPHLVTISRRVCGNLCVLSGPMTSIDLALWVAFVSDAASIPDEPDEDGLTRRDGWAIEDAAAVRASGRTLLAATGMRSHADLVRPFERLSETVVSLGLRSEGRHRLWQGWEADPIDRSTPSEIGVVSGIVLGQTLVTGDPFPVRVDTAAMARFRSRWSALMYLRALAWLNGAATPKAWRRTRPGPYVRVTIPIGELHRGLGTDALQGMGSWNARAFGAGGKGGPVHEDLESAGLRLKTTWVMQRVGGREIPAALSLEISTLKRVRDRLPMRIPAEASAPAV